jgi:hypothetical protein
MRRRRSGRERESAGSSRSCNNITSILAKLQATDRAEVIIRARDAGLGRDE